jgi:oligosaccharide repeat unit polymerase
MLLFDFPELAFTQIALILAGGIWMLRRNDEIPLLISGFIFYVSAYRYWVVTNGLGKWVNLGIVGGFDSITPESALSALHYIVIGEICLITTYLLSQRRNIPVIKPVGDRFLLLWLYPKAIRLGLICLPLVVYVRARIAAQVAAGQSLAFEVSNYLFLFPMVLIGVATLVLCIWKFGGFTSIRTKIIAFLILLAVSFYTFNPTSRFQFLGWIIASAIILSSSYKSKTRFIIFVIAAIIGISVFAIAGVMRNSEIADDAVKQAAAERALSAEDANMLDGFVLQEQFYPKRADFRWGMEHLEILMRPIPRALWPEKPIGGGPMAQASLATSKKKFTIGISPTLFGSFYAEGGLLGIIWFSIIYGRVFAAIISHSTRLHPFASILIRAIFCACLLPLLRGGDLPGIYAWFGMAFWPCFLLLWNKRTYFRQYPLFMHSLRSNSIFKHSTHN